MNLSQIFRIFRRRWLFIAIPAAIVLLLTILTAEEAVLPPSSYNVGVRFLISPPLPNEGASPIEQERYYQWLTSEYLTNGMADWVNGIGFAEKVSAKMSANGVEVDPLVIFNGTSADAIRSRLTVIMNYADPDVLQLMMESAIEVIDDENGSGIPHLGLDAPAEIVLLDRPVVNEVPASIGNQLDLPVRIVLAVIIGLLVGFAVEYFDPFVRDTEDVKRVGLPILALGPAETMGPNLRGSLLLQEPVPSSIVIAGTVGHVIDEVSLDAAYSLATAMANSGRKTILVDGILVQPLLHTVAGVDNESGFAESLATNETLRLQQSKIKNLKVLSAGNAGSKAADLISSPYLAGILDRLKRESDVLILVAPPPVSGLDMALLGVQTDGVVINVERGLSWITAVKLAKTQIERSGSRMLGAIVSG